jgi:hypothetical protein
MYKQGIGNDSMEVWIVGEVGGRLEAVLELELLLGLLRWITQRGFIAVLVSVI